MTVEKIKQKLLKKFPKEIITNLTPPFIALIDETIESIIDGTTTLNGKKADSEEEIIGLAYYGLLARLQLFESAISSAKKMNADNVLINYRGTTIRVK